MPYPSDDCPSCGGGFYAGTCINGYHPWTYTPGSWPKLSLRKKDGSVDQEMDSPRKSTEKSTDTEGR